MRKRLAIRILAHIFWATSVGGCVTAVYFANIKQSDLVADNGCISTSFEDLVDADNLKQTAICTFYGKKAPNCFLLDNAPNKVVGCIIQKR